MTTEILDTVASINPDDWNQLVKGHPFAGWHWLQISEALSLDVRLRYVLVSDHSNLLAGAVCSVQDRFHSRLLQASMGWLPQHYPYLRCDMPLFIRSGLFFADPTQIDSLFPELLQAIQRLAATEKALFYSFDHILPADPIWSHLREHNCHRVEHIGDAYLDIRWSNLDDYLRSLGPQVWQKYLSVQELLVQQDITIEFADPETENPERLQQLVRNFALQKQKPYLDRRDLFSVAHTLLDQQFQLLIARQGDQRIGGIALLHDDNQWLARWPGLETEHQFSNEVYLAILIACIHQTIITGGQRLYLGLIADLTFELGTTIEKRFGATVVRNRPLHWLAGKLLKFTANPEATQ